MTLIPTKLPPRRAMAQALLAVSGAFLIDTAHAAETLLQPARELVGDHPLELVLILSQDTAGKQRYTIPEVIEVDIVTTDGLAPRRLALHHATSVPSSVVLASGQFRKIEYQADWPKDVRGTVQIAPVTFNAAPSVVVLNWAGNAPVAGVTATPVTAPPAAAVSGSAQGQAPQQTATQNPNANISADASAPPAGLATATSAPSSGGTSQPSPAAAHSADGSGNTPPPSPAALTQSSDDTPQQNTASTQASLPPLTTETTRISFNEPVYFAIGPSEGDTTAKFQLSFKYRIFEPKDPRSRSLLDNLYFGYTQLSIWDLSEDSKPFKDTNFRPSLFYYLPDTGARASWFSTLGIEAGVEHESNGQSGSDSRSINTVFVRPIFTWNNVLGNRLVVAPKVYYYLEKSDNPDIQRYRGYVDLLIKYGNPDGLELATTLRKGTSSSFGSIDAQLTYPLQKLFGAGFGGYVWLGAFSGYGETLIDYNHHSNSVRIGYSIAR
ncbi:MAG TPA: phospholipase A [Pararobbsia sp.]|nr:phospholipase A [Pararobbsia sp.]